MPIIVGIDPGASTTKPGGIALIDLEARHVEAHDLPVRVPPRVKGRKKPSPLVDGVALAKMLRGLPDDTVIVIEKVGAMAKQGVRQGAVSAFNFGNTAGCIRGVAEALGFKIVFVTPQVWKKKAGLIGTEKDAARILALKKYPSLAASLKRKRDGGRADGLLIADWGVGTLH